MSLHTDFVKMLANADRFKEAGYHDLSKYMNSTMGAEFHPEMQYIIAAATRCRNSEDGAVVTVGQLAMVAMVDYMERFQKERLENTDAP